MDECVLGCLDKKDGTVIKICLNLDLITAVCYIARVHLYLHGTVLAYKLSLITSCRSKSTSLLSGNF